MRLWSIHPQYLDRQGLLALWREALLAKHVLEGKTKGYKKHPQLVRFKTTEKPLDCINQYLSAVYEEAVKRGYDFERNKINWDF
ncbi:MAG: pyrimidine dimer DNA glycosylase/endonuclease V, partial [Bacteroidota bacterium]|nr:pyrimidine dimer DNA glycosylase/endonuclease V [Bacteroidota bacterium]